MVDPQRRQHTTELEICQQHEQGIASSNSHRNLSYKVHHGALPYLLEWRYERLDTIRIDTLKEYNRMSDRKVVNAYLPARDTPSAAPPYFDYSVLYNS